MNTAVPSSTASVSAEGLRRDVGLRVSTLVDICYEFLPDEGLQVSANWRYRVVE